MSRPPIESESDKFFIITYPFRINQKKRGGSLVTFTVTINNWAKHNNSKKKNHRYFLLEYRFFEDEKVSQLRLIESSLYLKCLCIAADLMTERIVIHVGLMPRRWRVDVKLLENSLKTLQSFQLVTYEKNEAFINTIQYNTKENKRKQNKTPKAKVEASSDAQPPEKISDLIAHYCDTWKVAYKTNSNPIIQGKDAGNLNKFMKSVGYEKAKNVISAYLRMGDKWFITKRHDITTMLSNTNAIIQFMENGKLITQSELNNFDKNQTSRNLEKDILENGI